jgi:hypothetical protein
LRSPSFRCDITIVRHEIGATQIFRSDEKVNPPDEELLWAAGWIALVAGLFYLGFRRWQRRRQAYRDWLMNVEPIQPWSGRAFDGALLQHRMDGTVRTSHPDTSAHRRLSRLAEARQRISGLSFFQWWHDAWERKERGWN